MKQFALVICCLFSVLAYSQISIPVHNASFEEVAISNSDVQYPDRWHDYSIDKFPEETKPKVYDAKSKKLIASGVIDLPVTDGEKFTILFTRKNGSYQTIGQEINGGFKEGNTYILTINLAFLPQLFDYSSIADSQEGVITDFSKPVKLKILGSTAFACGKRKIIESIPIDHNAWKTYSFVITAKKDWDWIWLQAQHDKDYKHYNGHLLIDGINISELDSTTLLTEQCIISREKSLPFVFDTTVTFEDFETSWYKSSEEKNTMDEQTRLIIEYYKDASEYGLYRYVRDISPGKLAKLKTALKSNELSTAQLDKAAALAASIVKNGQSDSTYMQIKQFNELSDWKTELKLFLKMKSLLTH